MRTKILLTLSLLIVSLFVVGQSADGSFRTVTSSGGPTNYTISDPLPATYDSKEKWLVTFSTPNSGVATLNRNSLGPKDIKKADGTALSGGELTGRVFLSYNGTYYQVVGGSGLVLNGLTTSPQTLATGTGGSDFNISSVTATHTFNLPTASGSARGALSSSDWTTFNNKQNTLYFKNGLTKQADSTTVVLGGTLTDNILLDMSNKGIDFISGRYINLNADGSNFPDNGQICLNCPRTFFKREVQDSPYYYSILELEDKEVGFTGYGYNFYVDTDDVTSASGVRRLTIDSVGNISMPNTKSFTISEGSASGFEGVKYGAGVSYVDSTLISKGFADAHYITGSPTDFWKTTGTTTLLGTSTITGQKVIFNPSGFTSGTGIEISASTTDAASNTQKLFNVALSGANATSPQATFAAKFLNSKTGTPSTNYGSWNEATSGTSNIAGYFNAIGGTNNYAGIFENGSVGIGTAAPSQTIDVRSANNVASGEHFNSVFGNTSLTAGFAIGWYANGSVNTAGYIRAVNSLPVFIGTTGSGPVLNITDTGFLGVGNGIETVTIASTLHIKSYGTGAGEAFRINDSNDVNRLLVLDKGTSVWTPSQFTSGIGFDISASTTDAASNSQNLFKVALSGENATSSQTTYGADISNTKTGTGAINIALRTSASAGTTNYALAAVGNSSFVGKVGIGSGFSAPSYTLQLTPFTNSDDIILQIGATSQTGAHAFYSDGKTGAGNFSKAAFSYAHSSVLASSNGDGTAGISAFIRHPSAVGLDITTETETAYNQIMARIAHAGGTLTATNTNPMLYIARSATNLNGFDQTGAMIELEQVHATTGDFIKAIGPSSATMFAFTYDGRLYGTAIHNNAGSVTGTTNQYLASGTFTPTLTNVTNVAASTAYEGQWMRVGNVVTFSGKVDIDVTGVGATELGVSLPIASAMTVEQNLGGDAISAAAASLSAAIRADATNDRAAIVFTATSLTNDSYFFTLTYVIK